MSFVIINVFSYILNNYIKSFHNKNIKFVPSKRIDGSLPFTGTYFHIHFAVQYQTGGRGWWGSIYDSTQPQPENIFLKFICTLGYGNLHLNGNPNNFEIAFPNVT